MLVRSLGLEIENTYTAVVRVVVERMVDISVTIGAIAMIVVVAKDVLRARQEHADYRTLTATDLRVEIEEDVVDAGVDLVVLCIDDMLDADDTLDRFVGKKGRRFLNR